MYVIATHSTARVDQVIKLINPAMTDSKKALGASPALPSTCSVSRTQLYDLLLINKDNNMNTVNSSFTTLSYLMSLSVGQRALSISPIALCLTRLRPQLCRVRWPP